MTTTSTALTIINTDEESIYRAARAAVNSLMRTFENLITLGHAVVLARKQEARQPEGYKRLTFLDILEREKLASALGNTKGSIKSMASRLEVIMQPDILPKVLEWHAKLEPHDKIHRASITSIFRHCDALSGRYSVSAVSSQRDPEMPSESHRILKKENVRLAKELGVATAIIDDFHKAEEEGRETLFLHQSADDIVAALRRCVGEEMATQVFKAGLEALGYDTSKLKKKGAKRKRSPAEEAFKQSGLSRREYQRQQKLKGEGDPHAAA